MSLQRSLTLFRQRVMRENEQTRRAVILEVFSGTILDTPSDTGITRGNWQTNVGHPKTNEIDRADPNNVLARKEVLDEVGKSRWGDEVWLSNNKPHIGKLEYGGYPNPPKLGTWLKPGQTKGNHTGPGYFMFSANGFSKQAPAGMLRRNLERARKIIEARARANRR